MYHVADVLSGCCTCQVVARRTRKQPYPDDDIELVHIERTSFSMKEHESLRGINQQQHQQQVGKARNLIARILE